MAIKICCRFQESKPKSRRRDFCVLAAQWTFFLYSRTPNILATRTDDRKNHSLLIRLLSSSEHIMHSKKYWEEMSKRWQLPKLGPLLRTDCRFTQGPLFHSSLGLSYHCAVIRNARVPKHHVFLSLYWKCRWSTAGEICSLGDNDTIRIVSSICKT